MATETELNSLIGSRICHDLISPLGAIGNGVELLAMTGAEQTPEITLISESVDNANARIRYFRIAFGAASASSNIGNAELRCILDDLFKTTNRIKVDWRVPGDIPRAEAKLVFLIILCLESALPWGGRVMVTRTDDRWNLMGMAERLKIDEALWEVVANPQYDTAMNASEVQFALVQPAARVIGRRVTTMLKDSAISVSF
ncbi:MAG: histidine phosphotransferase [Silicimonas sp.]|nr:histidine phosphotransferase [Silicimonas sp.]